MSKSLILILIATALWSCSNDDSQIVLKAGWEEYVITPDDKYILSMDSIDTHLVTISGSGRVILIDDQLEIVTRLPPFHGMRYFKPALEHGFYIVLDDRQIETTDLLKVKYYNLWSFNSEELFLDIGDFDESFSAFKRKDARVGDRYGAFGENTLLIDYEINDPTKTGFALFEFDFQPGSLPLGERNFNLLNVSTFEIEGPSALDSHTFEFNGSFFMSTVQGLFTLKDDQVVQCTGIPGPSEMISYKNEYYAIFNRTIYRSIDGLNFNEWTQFNQSIHAGTFATINDQLILSLDDKIFQIDQNFGVLELSNDGLKGNFVTTLEVYNNRVFASTFSGLFHIELTNFFDVIE